MPRGQRGTPRLRRVSTDRPVYTSGGDKLPSFMPPSLLAPFHHCTLLSRCALHLASRWWNGVPVFLLFTFVRPAFKVWTESAPWTASHLLWLLILLHLLDRQDMSLHDPETLATSSMTLHMRNLHDFPIGMFKTSSSVLSERRSLSLVAESVYATPLGRKLFFQWASSVFRAFRIVGTCIKISEIPVKDRK